MKVFLYKMLCLTNLHVGNEGGSFTVIDREVEKDVNGYPLIHASGMKGALRSLVTDQALADRIFGKATKAGDGSGKGQYSFTDALMLYRPLRVVGSNPNFASIPVVTMESVRSLLETAAAFGCSPVANASIGSLDFGGKEFLTNVPGIRVEDEPTGILNDPAVETLLKQLVGEHFAITRSLADYALPVIARNNLDPKHPNLWYEEYVPHGSCFFAIIITPDGVQCPELPLDMPVQMGGNASIGYGYIKMERWGESK